MYGDTLLDVSLTRKPLNMAFFNGHLHLLGRVSPQSGLDSSVIKHDGTLQNLHSCLL